MTPADLLGALRARGVLLRAEGDRLRVNAPAGALTSAVRAALAEHKPALLEFLAAEERLLADLRAALEDAILAELGHRLEVDLVDAAGRPLPCRAPSPANEEGDG